MQTNYHTHTRRCRHASGTDEQYVKQAIQEGFKILGFSDHACWQYGSSYKSPIRMTVREFPGYKDSVEKLRKKYRNKIEILLGMEAEYFPKYMDWLLDFCIEQNIDYLIFGNHYFGSDEYGLYTGGMPGSFLKKYVDTCIEGLQTGMYSYLAHPDLPLQGLEWQDDMEPEFERLCKAAKEMDIPLEYNCSGLRFQIENGVAGYPHPEFWKIAARIGNKAIIGMDAHSPKGLDKELYEKARQSLEKLKIEILETIPKTDFEKIRLKKEAA